MSLPHGIVDSEQAPHRFQSRFYPEIVLSARMIVYRNLRNIPFPNRLPDREYAMISHQVLDSLHADPRWRESCFQLEAEQLEQKDADLLSERQFGDTDFFHRKCGSMFLKHDLSTVVYSGGSDHVKWTAQGTGVCFRQLADAFHRDSFVFAELPFASDDSIGFFTSDLHDAGGVRFYSILHLPAAFYSDGFAKIATELSSAGFQLTSLYGQLHPPPGALGLLTHKQCAGISVNELAERMEHGAFLLARWERAARRAMLREAKTRIQDMIARGFGILKHARSISREEFIALHSALRIGVDLGWIRGVTSGHVNRLVERAGIAYLRYTLSETAPEFDPDAARAKVIRDTMANARLVFDESLEG